MSGGIPCLCCFAASPPQEGAKAKGSAGAKYGAIVKLKDQPNEFKTSLASAPCGDPLCCCYGFFCQPCAACYWRKAFLEKIGNGVQDYVCCQGYIPKCCCFDFPNMGKGSLLCLCCEGCCCDVLSLSITRIYVMDMKRLHPDPGDYQIIQFSNCMQMVACICHVLAYVDNNFRELAMIVDCIANIVERCVSGCMSAQLSLEYNDDAGNEAAKGKSPQFTQDALAGGDNFGAPVVAIDDKFKDEEIKEAEMMERET